MKSLLIVAHGSRRSASNEEVAKLAKLVSQQSQNTYDHVQCAFLELAKPSIPEGILDCVEKGSTYIAVLPYFLAAGRHVIEDIPHEVSLANCDPEKVVIEIKPHVGADANMPGILLNMAL